MTRYISQGITLIEMMIVIVILSILLAIAVPNFSNLILSNQISSNASDFVDSLRLAKKEANARRTTVIVCIRQGNACSTNAATGWNNGWIVFLDANGNNTVDNGETIYEYQALDPRITFTAADINGGALGILSFTPSGNTNLTGSGAATFTLSNQDGTISRGIRVTVAGHASPL